MTIEFTDASNPPEENQNILIKYRFRDKNHVNHDMFFIGTGYLYKGEYWVGFHSPFTFPKTFEVLGWSYYDATI